MEAFAAYGKEVRTCGAARLRAVRARAREFGEASVVEAVHGYMALHRRRDDERFDPLQYLTPETIYRPSHFAKYLDAYRAATAAGETPPFTGGHDPYAAAAADFRARRHRATH